MRTLLLPVVAIVSLFLSADRAKAGIDWTYIGDKDVTITSGSSALTFHGTVGGAANSTGVVIYNITANSSAPNDGPFDHFEKTPFSLSVTIVDELARTTLTGNELGTVTFDGFFTGDLSKGSLTNWSVSWDKSFASVVLGNDDVGERTYDIAVDGFLPPSPNNPEVNGRGTVHSQVTVTPGAVGNPPTDPPTDPPTNPPTDPTPDPSETPEPTSLLLAGLGLSSIAVARWRRRKN